MHSWLVAGALIEGPDGLLLVQNRRRNGRVDWSPPGGVIDAGEQLLDGLTREVEEETGLRVASWQGPVYEVHAEAPDLGWSLRVEVHRAMAYDGDLHVDDPDGIVVDAGWFDAEGCLGCLHGGPAWVREPLAEWLVERWEDGRQYGFDVMGSDLASLSVSRR